MQMYRFVPVAFAFAMIAACGNEEAGGAPGEAAQLLLIDTLVTTDSGEIGGVYDLAVSPDGRVFVADYGFKHILVVAPGGSTRTVGQEGDGPGEFRMPYSVGAALDSFRVFDATTNLVQVFGAEGGMNRSYRLDIPGLGAGRSFGGDGSLAATVDGFEDSMVMVFDPTGQRAAKYGQPIVPPVTSYDFTALKDEIQDGRVPGAFRNRAIVAWGPEGSLYVVFLAEPEVRRYEKDGSLRWSRRLEEPEFAATFDRFIKRNTEERNPSRIYPLQYVIDANAVHDELWILLNTVDQEDGRMLVLNGGDGSLRRRLIVPFLPNTGPFDVDEGRGHLFMAPRDEASVLVFAIPDGV